MCGIVGTYLPSLAPEETRRALEQMAAAMAHRGPDDDGFFVAPQVGLAMRRLSIIDLDGGQQPISNEDGSVVLVFNGEIYNYRELTTTLRQRGHHFRTASDTEVIVHLYEEYGRDCVDHLRGMFAFALWDIPRQQLFIARDRLGIKPLYYTDVAGTLVFASEIKSLLQYPGVESGPDFAAIGQYLALKYAPAPRTMFAGIHSLPPGYTLSAGPQGVDVRPYWNLSYRVTDEKPRADEEYAERLDELLRESVRLRLRSDVPFGAFLSGGVDSSTIVALMSEMLHQPVKTFSVGFESRAGEQDELPYARRVAQQYATEHHEVILRPDDLVDLAEKVVWHLDQPIADQATLATYAVARLARRHVKMVLTGEGGDELFAGYARYPGDRLAPLFRALPGPLRALTLASAERLPRLRRAKIALYALCQTEESTRLANWFPLFNDAMREELLTAAMTEQCGGPLAGEAFAEQLYRSDARHPLNRMLHVDTKLWLPDFLLLRGDKLTMANSLEARVPLLDHKVVEFAAGLPPRLKLRRMTRKYLLKRVAARYLPPEILHRKKQGFPIPISSWFRRELREYVRDLLAPSTLQRRGMFRPAYVERLIEQHERGFADHGALLWGLMSLELWFRLYHDAPAGASVNVNTTSTTAPLSAGKGV